MLSIPKAKALAVVMAMSALPATPSAVMAAEAVKSESGSSAVVARVAGVEVVRGHTDWRVTPPKQSLPTAARQIYAGERLWLVDRQSETVSACRLIRSNKVGSQIIRCTTRRLPN